MMAPYQNSLRVKLLHLMIVYLSSCATRCFTCISTENSYFCFEISGRFMNYTTENINALYFINSDLTELTSADLRAFTALIILSVKNCTILAEQTKTLFSNLSRLQELEITHTNISESIGIGTINNVQLTELNLSNNSLKAIDIHMFAKIKSLRNIDISYNEISQLDSAPELNNKFMKDDRTVGESNIISINLRGNKIVFLRNYSVSTFRKLQDIDISQNNIQTIEKFAFNFSDTNCVPQLTNIVLNISHNRISQINESNFILCSSLTDLDLSHNVISKMDINAFNGLSLVRRLILRSNFINELPSNVFLPMNKLLELDLYGNDLTEVMEDTFGAIPTLSILCLNENKIRRLQPYVFRNLLSLQELYLGGNGLKHLGGVFNVFLPSLHTLEIQMNSIKSIEFDSFNGSLHLIRLNLGDNRIHEIENGAFKSNSLLEVLLLNRNSISYLNCHSFFGLWNLKILDVSGNELKEVALFPFSYLSSLQKLFFRLEDDSKCECALFSKFKAQHVEILLEKKVISTECEKLLEEFYNENIAMTVCDSYSRVSNCLSGSRPYDLSSVVPLETLATLGTTSTSQKNISKETTAQTMLPSNRPDSDSTNRLMDTAIFKITAYIVSAVIVMFCIIVICIVGHKIWSERPRRNHIYEIVTQQNLRPETDREGAE